VLLPLTEFACPHAVGRCCRFLVVLAFFPHRAPEADDLRFERDVRLTLGWKPELRVMPLAGSLIHPAGVNVRLEESG